MKLTLFFLFFSILLSQATNTFSQETEFTLHLKSATIKEVCKEMEKSSNYRFIFEGNANRAANKKVDLSANSQNIEEILDELLSGTDLSYRVLDNQVVVYRDREKREVKGVNRSVTTQTAQQQKKQITGRVVDAQGIPVIGANILEKGTSNGTVTDMDGYFSLSVGDNVVLHISYIGYITQEVAVGNRTNINVQLEEDTQRLEEVIVLGYGLATKRKDLSASVGIVADPESLAMRPVTSTQSMLQGQIPGVTVQANGGSPTSTPNIVIRGQGSQNGDGVLWVVDGVPGAPINSLADIESIVVLKDAASAAIYGAQSGAGGVIIVTTKKGQKGVSVSYDGLMGVRTATNVVQSLNAEQQIKMRQLSSANSGVGLDAGWDVNLNPYIGVTRTNWIDEIFRSALYHRHNVVLNSGTDTFKNRVGFSASKDDGVLVGTYNKSMGINYRGDLQINKWVKITEDFRFGQSDDRGVDTDSGYSGAIISAIYMPQSADKHYYTGSGFGGVTTEDPEYIAKYGSNYASIHGDVINPLRILTADDRYNRNNSFFTTTGMEIGNIVTGLKFNSKFSFYTNSGFYKNFSHMITEVGKPNASNSLEYSTYRNQGWKTENTLTFDRTFDKHTVGALLSTTSDYYSQRGFSATGSTFADESKNLQYFNFAEAWNKPSDYMTGPDANVALISRISYSFDDRYFMTASWRRDYAGRLPDANNYGDFPAITAAWKISNEAFFNSELINLLKVRGSFGRVGNLGSVGYNYKSQTLSSAGWNNQSQQYGFESDAGYTGTFYYNGKALNPKLTWETSEQFDAGLDIDMFANRLSISFDFYNKRTYNLIQSQSSGWPASIGVSPMLVNLGEIMNRGFEAQFGWKDRIGKEWSYFLSANAAYNKNWVADIGVTTGDGSKGVWTGGGAYRQVPYIYQTKEGGPLNQFYMIKYLGIFQSDAEAQAYTKDGVMIQPNAKAGDLKFEDYNGDGKIDALDRQYVGNATPDWTYAFSGGFSWKDLTLSLMLQGVQGAQAAYMAKYSLLGDVEGNFNRSVDILDAWSPTNTDSKIPRLSRSDPNGNFTTPSTWYLEDASYLRFKNITVTYDLTRMMRKCSHFLDRGSSLSVYFSGENLFTITPYSGMDPETGGWDALKYPVSRVLSLGVKLTY
ncbi:SusC/RagA family TonB-linked outer membrane protein [Petrimonas mucosa]|nr:SusC/RagA family TonB-linked outer membrane protein [Petrimonas mucosa]